MMTFLPPSANLTAVHKSNIEASGTTADEKSTENGTIHHFGPSTVKPRMNKIRSASLWRNTPSSAPKKASPWKPVIYVGSQGDFRQQQPQMQREEGSGGWTREQVVDTLLLIHTENRGPLHNSSATSKEGGRWERDKYPSAKDTELQLHH